MNENGARRVALPLLLGCLTLSAAAGAAGPILVIGDNGVGGITRDTPFDPKAISQALPGLAVERAEATAEGIAYPVIRVLRDKHELLVLAPDLEQRHVGSLMSASPEVASSQGVTVGASFQQIYERQTPSACEAGVEEWSGMVFCPAPASNNVQLLFKGQWSGPDGNLPPPEVLRTWTVAQIWWLPPEE
ncbi:MAG TPA: DUF1131 family protein [Candidatus Competibacteraceae bacterium]|nr:DUF1131 family protein [Candidatus Competibacteraceae bacterium]